MSSSQPQQTYRLLPKVPGPLQRLFDAVPLVTYEPNELPARSSVASSEDDIPRLYVFIREEDAARQLPSFNPTCLKWQTFLRISNHRVRLIPSTNHASPTGALPFLLPADSTTPIAAHNLPSYVTRQGTNTTTKSTRTTTTSSSDGSTTTISSAHTTTRRPRPATLPPATTPRLRAYQSLLDTSIRRAWLHALYVAEANAAELPRALYASRASASRPVQAALLHQLRRAAEDEVGVGDDDDASSEAGIYGAARDALAALEVLLLSESGGGGEDGWFFGGVPPPGKEEEDDEEDEEEEEERGGGGGGGVQVGGPTLFDASVFAYTYLLLDDRMGWVDRRLVNILEGFPALVRHRDRLLERYWGGEGSSAAAATAAVAGVEDSAVWEKV